MGNFSGYLLLIQCKNYSASTKVSVDQIYKLEGVMSKYPAKTVGIFVVPFYNSYTRRAIEKAQNSKYKIILTDTLKLYNEINNLDNDYEDENDYDYVYVYEDKDEDKDKDEDAVIENNNYFEFNVHGKVSE